MSSKLKKLQAQISANAKFSRIVSSDPNNFTIGIFDGPDFIDYQDNLKISKVGLLNCYRNLIQLNGATPCC